jgi:hypothetical protein
MKHIAQFKPIDSRTWTDTNLGIFPDKDEAAEAVIHWIKGYTRQNGLTPETRIIDADEQARLVDAAPDLLDALRDLLQYIEGTCPEPEDSDTIETSVDDEAPVCANLAAARQAIAKATGGN